MIWLKRAIGDLARWLRLSPEYDSRNPRFSVSILAVMPNQADCSAMLRISERAHWHLQVGNTFDSAVDILRSQDFAVILYDRDLPGLNWREAVGRLAAKAPRTSVILTSPVNDDYLWQEVIQCGGSDVLTRPFQEERVVKTITFACWKTDLARPRLQSERA